MFNQAPYLEKDGHKLSGPISFDLQHIPHGDVPYTRTFIYHPSSQKYTLGQGHIQPLLDQVEPGDFLQLRNIFTPGIDTIRFGYQMKIALKNEPVQERGFLDPRLAGVYMTRGMRYNE